MRLDRNSVKSQNKGWFERPEFSLVGEVTTGFCWSWNCAVLVKGDVECLPKLNNLLCLLNVNVQEWHFTPNSEMRHWRAINPNSCCWEVTTQEMLCSLTAKYSADHLNADEKAIKAGCTRVLLLLLLHYSEQHIQRVRRSSWMIL